jgi:hypothetical protein
MSSEPHLEIFNPVQSIGEERRFLQFPRLPTELRLQIWRYALQKRRIIQIALFPIKQISTATFGPENIINYGIDSEQYCVYVEGHGVLSKFLRVNREARETALSFYRIHIPCVHGSQYLPIIYKVAGAIYLNPEYDFLHIRQNWIRNDSWVDFIHQLKTTWDPRHVGLLNVILDDSHYLSRAKSGISLMTAQSKSGFLQSISQLHEVIFWNVSLGHRIIVAPHYGPLTPDMVLNRSFPIIPNTREFEFLGADPRPVDHDLKRLNMCGGDPRRFYSTWRSLLTKWGVSPPPQTNYRYLFAQESRDVRNRTGARDFLEKEYERWTNPTDPDFAFGGEGPGPIVKSAFGFWLFPVDAFGLFHDDGSIKYRDDERPPRLGIRWPDMSASRPELALSSLA